MHYMFQAYSAVLFIHLILLALLLHAIFSLAHIAYDADVRLMNKWSYPLYAKHKQCVFIPHFL